MTHAVHKVIEVVGTSPESSDDAIRTAIEEASKTLRLLEWFEVVESRGRVKDGRVAEYQVTLKVGFHLDHKG